METCEQPVLRLQNLSVRYRGGCPYCLGGGRLEKNRCPRCGAIHAVRSLSLELYEGEILGVVGESGSGKSTMLQSLYFDQDVTEGSAFLRGYKDGKADLFAQNRREKRFIRSHILGMVYQNPMLGLRMDVSSAGNIAEKMLAAGERRAAAITQRAQTLLRSVDILPARMTEAPRWFSGGMQQRVQISKALANNPSVLLLDEVTTGLDLSVQARVLDLIKRIRAEYGVSMLLVSHDLSVIRMLADRTVVMLDGQIVESGLTDQILDDPQHPYTQTLVYSLL